MLSPPLLNVRNVQKWLLRPPSAGSPHFLERFYDSFSCFPRFPMILDSTFSDIEQNKIEIGKNKGQELISRLLARKLYQRGKLYEIHIQKKEKESQTARETYIYIYIYIYIYYTLFLSNFGINLFPHPTYGTRRHISNS